jgi:carboxynorspermidine decarboxylase
VENPVYDPCAAWSRLGATAENLSEESLAGIQGLHLHALCDQVYAPFERLLAATEARFAPFLEQVRWINLGGGQLLTAGDYPVDALIERLRAFRRRWGLDVYLEPGTAVALEAGVLVAEVLDTGWNDGHFALLDVSATCHIPDVIEAPYTPDLLGATIAGDVDQQERRDDRVCRLGGPTCLAGDIIGTYRLAQPLSAGDRLIFLDTAYYTMVKSTTFNGARLPAIALWDSRTDDLSIVREFDYEAFESRLS